MFQVNPLPRQRIHLKHQAIFSSKDKSKKLKCRLLQFLFGAFKGEIEILIGHDQSPYSFRQTLLPLVSTCICS